MADGNAELGMSKPTESMSLWGGMDGGGQVSAFQAWSRECAGMHVAIALLMVNLSG